MIINKTIFFLLPNGITVRNFLNTGIIDELISRKNIRLVIFTSSPLAFEKHNNERVIIKSFIKRRKISLSGLLNIILRRRFYKVNQTVSNKILSKGPLFPENHSKILEYLLSQPFPKSKAIYNLLRSVDKKIKGFSSKVLKVFKEFEPSLVISTHPISMDEYEFLSCSNKLDIKTIGIIKSWDNLTTKGYIPVKLDHYLAWNEIIKNELIKIHHVQESQISVTGIPQFDLYFDKANIIKRDKFFKKMNLDPNNKTIFFATSPSSIGPEDPDIIFEKMKFLKNNKIKNIQVIARLHPLDNIERYKKLKDSNFSNLTFQIPGKNSKSKVSGIINPEFITELRDTLFYSDVTINTCSTTSLDAVAMDKPVINIAFDLKPRKYYRSCRRYYDFAHFQPILNSGATKLASNFDEYINLIFRYLEKSDLEKKQRKNLREIMCYKVDGQSSLRIANAFIQQLK